MFLAFREIRRAKTRFALLIGASPHRWEIELADTRTRQVTSPSGEPAELEDAILLARRV